MIVDITADQFEEIDAPVLVTTDRVWHGQFEVETCHPADFEQYDSHTKAILAAAYELVTAYLE